MEDIVPTDKDREKHKIINESIEGKMTNAEAAAKLGITVRQVRRLKRKVEEFGAAGVVHGGRGQASNRATHPDTKKTIIAFLKKKKHRDFGPTFAQEKLSAEGTVRSIECVRGIMVANDLWKPHARRKEKQHHAWRPRMGMYGELVQFDGSYHDWLENGDEECLLAAIDDATSTIPLAVFEENEGVHAVFRFWQAYIELHGLPVAIYLDKFSTYKVNHKNAVDNIEMKTQFERAMRELGIKVITAHSPEAKGRIERLFGTLQDRLVKEMRLCDIKTRDKANAFLVEEYLPNHNARFGVHAQNQGDAHRPLTEEMRARLPSIFSIQSKRTVNNDYTIQFKNRWYQLSATQDTTVYKRDTVTIEERLDGTVHIRLKNTYLAHMVIPKRPKSARMKVTALTGEKPIWKPPANHPWRKRPL